MANESILLNFAVPVTVQDVLPSADVSWLKNVAVIVSGETPSITVCESVAEVQAVTDSSCYELINAGMNSIVVVVATSIATGIAALLASSNRQMTVLIDPAFTDLTPALALTRDYVLGWQTATQADAVSAAAADKVCAFYDPTDTDGILMYRAFGKLLSQSGWKNLQFAQLDTTDEFGITSLGTANTLFNAGVSFALTDAEYKTSLALFAAGKKTIVAPYILQLAKIQTQSLFVQYLSLRNPDYTIRESALIESWLFSQLTTILVDTGYVSEFSITVDLDPNHDDWYLSGVLQVARPRAIWRMNLDFYQDIIGDTNG